MRYSRGLWDGELHKRSFGFDKCRGDTIIRIDADEIFDFDDSAYEAFLRSDHGVGEMEFPPATSSKGRTNLMIALPICASCPCRPDDNEDECKYI